MRTKSDHFKDRKQAGEKLGLLLKSKYKDDNPLVIGIPRGGLEVAWYVARCLHAALSLIISKKLPFPHNKELGFGAIAEENTIYVTSFARELLPEYVVNQVIDEQSREIERRIKEYRQGKPLPEMTNKTVIVVDDGIATGVTLVPVLRLCRDKGAVRVIIAAPVSGTDYDKELDAADAIEILVQPRFFYSVGQVYDEFGDFSDREVKKLLKEAF